MASKDPLVANIDTVIKKWEAKQTSCIPARQSEASAAWKKFAEQSDSSNSFNRLRGKVKPRTRRSNRFDNEDWYPDALMEFKTKFHLATPELPSVKPHQLYACQGCTGGQAVALDSRQVGLVDLFSLPRSMSRSPFHMLFCNVRFAFSRQPFAYPTNVSSSDTLESMRFQERIRSRCRNLPMDELRRPTGNLASDLSTLIAKAKGILQGMHASISNFWLRVTCFVLMRTLNGPFRCITFYKEDVVAIKRESTKAVPLVFLPLHKSHLDYMLITLLLFSNNIRVPHIAAGENMGAVFGFGFLLRRLSAFFIKRRIGSNDTLDGALYNSVLQEYVEQLLRNGQSISVFIEGTRSRTGKCLVPKPGLLSLIVNAVSEGIIPDVKIVPVSVCYERLPEADGYVDEALGVSKTPESLWQFFQSTLKLMRSSFGRVHISFGKPHSMQALLHKDKSHRVKSSAMVRKGSENQLLLLASDVPYVTASTTDVGYHAVHNSSASEMAMSTNILSFLLSYKFRRHTSVLVADLVDSFDWLTGELEDQDISIGFCGSTSDVIVYAALILQEQGCVEIESVGHHVRIEKNQATKEIIRLHFAANQICAMLAGKAIIATSLLSTLDIPLAEIIPGKSMANVTQQQLLSKSSWLATLLSREFIICPPCRTVESYFEKLIEQFESQGILVRSQETRVRPAKTALHADMYDWDDEWEAVDDGTTQDIPYEVQLTQANLEMLSLLKLITSPLLESYWIASLALLPYSEQDDDKSSFSEGDLLATIYKMASSDEREFVSCRSRVALKNAVSVMVDVGVLQLANVTPEKATKNRLLQVSDRYRHNDNIVNLSATIAAYR